MGTRYGLAVAGAVAAIAAIVLILTWRSEEPQSVVGTTDVDAGVPFGEGVDPEEPLPAPAIGAAPLGAPTAPPDPTTALVGELDPAVEAVVGATGATSVGTGAPRASLRTGATRMSDESIYQATDMLVALMEQRRGEVARELEAARARGDEPRVRLLERQRDRLESSLVHAEHALDELTPPAPTTEDTEDQAAGAAEGEEPEATDEQAAPAP
ncbi:MAG: hypothetical protein U0234_08235 [Sandaracinus sp.]